MSLFLQLYGSDAWIRKTVSGEANFTMQHTGLTIGGFTQPSVARNLLEQPINIEKGLCQRFLWLVPKPSTVAFDDLQRVNIDFMTSIVSLLATLWTPDTKISKWILRRPCAIFRSKYDRVTGQLEKISCMDDLLSGMLSKSKGQTLRIAAAMHVLFSWETPATISPTISDQALEAADNFVEVCIQHAAFLAGRGVIADEISSLQERGSAGGTTTTTERGNTHFSLLLPGKVLHFNALNETKIPRERKQGGCQAGLAILGGSWTWDLHYQKRSPRNNTAL